MELNASFTQVLTDVTTQSKDIGSYFIGGSAPRPWMIPTNATSFNPTNIQALGAAFNRDALNEEYASQLTGNRSTESGHMGHLMADSLQLAYMMMWERSFRERHKTDVRMRMHLAGRRTAHGDAEHGVHIGNTKQYAQTFIDNAGTK